MNAKEFAHELEKVASFIRQQQAKIEALKSKTLTEDTECQYCKQGCIRCDARKLLTDEEITYLAKRFEGVWSGEVDYKGFAKAILRKASEK